MRARVEPRLVYRAIGKLKKWYRRNERAYEERVREIEHGSFLPLVFSTSGGMGPIATVVYKRIASQIAEKRDQPYNRTLFWIRCKPSFSLLQSAMMCIRGSRSSYHHRILHVHSVKPLTSLALRVELLPGIKKLFSYLVFFSSLFLFIVCIISCTVLALLYLYLAKKWYGHGRSGHSSSYAPVQFTQSTIGGCRIYTDYMYHLSVTNWSSYIV